MARSHTRIQAHTLNRKLPPRFSQSSTSSNLQQTDNESISSLARTPWLSLSLSTHLTVLSYTAIHLSAALQPHHNTPPSRLYRAHLILTSLNLNRYTSTYFRAILSLSRGCHHHKHHQFLPSITAGPTVICFDRSTPQFHCDSFVIVTLYRVAYLFL